MFPYPHLVYVCTQVPRRLTSSAQPESPQTRRPRRLKAVLRGAISTAKTVRDSVPFLIPVPHLPSPCGNKAGLCAFVVTGTPVRKERWWGVRECPVRASGQVRWSGKGGGAWFNGREAWRDDTKCCEVNTRRGEAKRCLQARWQELEDYQSDTPQQVHEL